MSGNGDLRATAFLAVGCAILALLLPWEAASLVFAAPLCLLLPGYAITCAAFGSRRLNRGRLFALSLGMSLVCLVLSALVLNYVPGGIRDVSWAAILVLVVLACARLAATRREAPGAPVVPGRRVRAARADLALLGAAAVAVIAALVVSATVFSADSAVGYTRLAMLPTKNRKAVRIGVQSNEQRRHAFRLIVRYSGRDLLRSRFSLDPGAERTAIVPFRRHSGGHARKVTASLYRESSPGRLFRRVTYWVAPDESSR